MRRYLLALLILALVVTHLAWPGRVKLDWPTITLLAMFISLIGARELSRFLPLVKRLKLGEAEIEMQESVQKLHRDVEKAEESTGPQVVPQDIQRADSFVGTGGEGFENNILELASRDKESAVVRLVIEIEKELGVLFQKAGLGSDPPRTIREMVNQLVSQKVLSPETGAAIIEFRNVRNKVIHPTQAGAIPESVLVSSIDSGIRILRLLRTGSTK